MNIATIFDPSTNTDPTFNIGVSNGTGRMVVYNESKNNLMLGWGAFTTYCPAWTAMLYCVQNDSPNIQWSIISTILGPSYPISQVVVEVYGPGEFIQGAFPLSLIRGVYVGNQGGGIVSVATNIVNDGNIAGTQIVESTVMGDSASAVTLTNDGKMTLGSVANPGFLTMLGPLTTPSLLLKTGSLSRVALFNGTGVGGGVNVAHGLGATPDFIMIMYTSGVPGTPIFYKNVTSTQLNVVADAGFTFAGMAIKL